MKKIGIVELFHHEEILQQQLRILRNTNLEVTFFVNTEVKNLVFFEEGNNFSFENYDSKKENIRAFLNRNSSTIKDCDLIFINSLPSHFEVVSAFFKNLPVVLLIHNCHAWLQGETNYFYGSGFKERFFQMGRIFRSILKKERFHRRKILENSKAIWFFSESLKNYSTPFLKEKKVGNSILLPISFFEKRPEVPTRNSDSILVTIPGTVYDKTRDYAFLAKALIDVKERFRKKVEFVFLGRIRSDSAKKHLDSLSKAQSENFKITFFESSLSGKIYNDFLEKTDFFLLPLKEEIPFSIYRELQSRSKTTGALNDALKFGIPIIAPSFFNADPPMNLLTVKFDSEQEFSELLIDWINNSTYKQLKKEHLRVFQANNFTFVRNLWLEKTEDLID